MNIESLRRNSKSKLFIVFMMACALFLGYVSCKKPIVSIAMVVGTLYLICLSKKAMWAYFLMILVSVNFFGFTFGPATNCSVIKRACMTAKINIIFRKNFRSASSFMK